MTEERGPGTYIRYVDQRFGAEKMELIRRANIILDEYERAGDTMTLRQLYYQFVARGLFENRLSNYTTLKVALSEGRLAGLVSWTAMEDRTRNLQGLTTHDSPAGIMRAAAASFKMDLWEDQEWRPEVWVEKEALVGVIESICNDLRVDFFAVRGYNSQSEQWRAGRRFSRYVSKGQRPIVFHLGDHDPSGLDMTRDNRDRLAMFAGVPIQVVRLALNMEQVERYDPPPNPAKLSDARAADYVARYGDESWELDALPPNVIRSLIAKAVHDVRDLGRWESSLAREVEAKETLDEMIRGMED